MLVSVEVRDQYKLMINISSEFVLRTRFLTTFPGQEFSSYLGPTKSARTSAGHWPSFGRCLLPLNCQSHFLLLSLALKAGNLIKCRKKIAQKGNDLASATSIPFWAIFNRHSIKLPDSYKTQAWHSVDMGPGLILCCIWTCRLLWQVQPQEWTIFPQSCDITKQL